MTNLFETKLLRNSPLILRYAGELDVGSRQLAYGALEVAREWIAIENHVRIVVSVIEVALEVANGSRQNCQVGVACQDDHARVYLRLGCIISECVSV